MEQIAEVYARSLFQVAKEKGALDPVREQLGQFDDALQEHGDLKTFLFSPQFSTDEKIEGLHKAVEGARPEVTNFLEALLERSRMPAIHRIRRIFDEMWDKENKLLPVEITSAVELDAATIERIGSRIGEQTGEQVQLSKKVDPEIIGGIVVRVGNQILDASVRTRLERLRRAVATA